MVNLARGSSLHHSQRSQYAGALHGYPPIISPLSCPAVGEGQLFPCLYTALRNNSFAFFCSYPVLVSYQHG